MKWENSIVKIKVKSTEINFRHPLNIFGTESSSGTGFFFCEDKSLILTCYHVIKYAVDIEVIYNYKYNCQAEIKYIFPDDDLAIIKIIDINKVKDNVSLNFIEISDDKNYDVYTIGYPLNSKTIKISKGIISGYQDSLIQTDATLNSGNSGGPLILKKDELYFVIGINVSKMVGDAEKTGFVVPYYRFKILYEKITEYKNIIINKPVLYFDYQKIIQNELINELYQRQTNYIDKQIGVRITFINN
jgi:serine protease Do